MTMQDKMDKCYGQLDKLFSGGRLGVHNWMILVTTAMNMVEELKDLKGYEKKDLVIALCKKLIENNIDYEEDKKAYRYLLDTMIPNFIDILFEDFNFRKLKRKYFWCC
jgi:hypothetical protein